MKFPSSAESLPLDETQKPIQLTVVVREPNEAPAQSVESATPEIQQPHVSGNILQMNAGTPDDDEIIEGELVEGKDEDEEILEGEPVEGDIEGQPVIVGIAVAPSPAKPAVDEFEVTEVPPEQAIPVESVVILEAETPVPQASTDVAPEKLAPTQAEAPVELSAVSPNQTAKTPEPAVSSAPTTTPKMEKAILKAAVIAKGGEILNSKTLGEHLLAKITISERIRVYTMAILGNDAPKATEGPSLPDLKDGIYLVLKIRGDGIRVLGGIEKADKVTEKMVNATYDRIQSVDEFDRADNDAKECL